MPEEDQGTLYKEQGRYALLAVITANTTININAVIYGTTDIDGCSLPPEVGQYSDNIAHFLSSWHGLLNPIPLGLKASDLPIAPLSSTE